MSIRLIAIVLITVCVSACSPDTKTPNTGKMKVAASFFPVAHFARQVGGDSVEVSQIIPAHTEAHAFEPTPKHIQLMEDTDVVIFVGGDVDPWAERLEESLRERGVHTVGLLSRVQPLQWEDEEENHAEEHDEHEEGQDEEDEHAHEGQYDPHIWLDPVRAIAMVEHIRDAFIAADPANADTYRNQGIAYIRELEDLDVDFRNGISSCALDTVIVAHDAFQYLAHRYGFTTRAISGFSPEQEPAPQRMAELATMAKDLGIRHIFFESLVDPRLSQTIASEVGANTLVLHPLEGLTDEQLDTGATYASIMRENLANLRIALQCQ